MGEGREGGRERDTQRDSPVWVVYTHTHTHTIVLSVYRTWYLRIDMYLKTYVPEDI